MHARKFSDNFGINLTFLNYDIRNKITFLTKIDRGGYLGLFINNS